jgi:hypothetical protein
MNTEKPTDALVVSIEGNINEKPPGTLFNERAFERKDTLPQELVKNGNGAYAFLNFDSLNATLLDLRSKSPSIRKRRPTPTE